MNLKELIKDPESLSNLYNIGQDLKDREQKEREIREESRLDSLKRYCFKSKAEMLTYMKAGNRIANRYGYPKEGLSMENDKVKYTYMTYSDIDMPCGYDYKYYSEEEFLEGDKFFHPCESDYGYDDTWMKTINL